MPLGFSRAIFPRLCPFAQGLLVFRAHHMRYADAVCRIFPVRLCLFHGGLLSPSAEEKRPKAEPCSERFRKAHNSILGTNPAAGNLQKKFWGPAWRPQMNIASTQTTAWPYSK